ncbi:Surface antigen [Stigmatella aurantiaca]|uniref:Surface antigen n=1 Tax=Stigmatella aurantiaca TaxID=41 RepID=A0A1H7HMC2_STIAU|nr:BamA/TamA family outer membrane protein [Stigmatella aurantiaca]SEK49385.1 Surface antigen [Stigmatella aurantiaca]
MRWNPLQVPHRAPGSPLLLTLTLCLVLRAPAAQAHQAPPDAPVETPPATSESRVEPSDTPPRRTGWDLQGLPILNFNTDEGFGYGALVMLVDRADGTHEPFRYSLLAQFLQTTRQVASHQLIFDAPRFLGSPWRVGVEAAYTRARFAPYYGLGNTAERIREYATCEDRDALEDNPDVCPGNPDFRGLRYYTYDLKSLPRLRLNLRRAVARSWNLFLGYRFRPDRVVPRYSADDLGQSGDSKLMEDAKAGVLEGFEEGVPRSIPARTSEVLAGLQYDTRDVEASPSSGMFHELSVRGGAGPLGSQFDYWGATLHARFYLPVLPGSRRLVAGARVLADVLGGEVPLTLLPFFGGLEGKDGLGGVYSARGLLLRRFQGPAKLLLNGELRWTALSGGLFGQQFGLTLVGFVDSGRVWRNLDFQEGGGLKTSAGGGLRIAWNREFVIRADYGVGLSESTSGFYLDFGHLF